MTFEFQRSDMTVAMMMTRLFSLMQNDILDLKLDLYHSIGQLCCIIVKAKKKNVFFTLKSTWLKNLRGDVDTVWIELA